MVAFSTLAATCNATHSAPANQQLVCGMSLGYADPGATENTLVTEREPVSGFVKFVE